MRIEPLRAYRHAGGPDLTPVVAPPYDQIDADLQRRLHATSPHNIVRITLPLAEDGLDPYQAARRTLEDWLEHGVWRPDPEPALYVYRQTYRVEDRTVVRTGLIALGEVSDYRQGVVRPHERTHAGPRQDRMRLLEATGTDTGLLFMLVGDADGALRALTEPAGPPLARAWDLNAERHELWAVTDPARIAGLQAALAPRPVIIADGHHRYETAVEYARRHPEARLKLMAFCPLEGPGLTILANHRLVHGVPDFDLDRLAAAAGPAFAVEPLPDPLAWRPEPDAIGVVTAGGARRFRLRPDGADRIAWPAGTSPAWRRLAVSVLHEGLLRPHLGITDAMLDARTHVDYTADRGQAVRLAGSGRYQAAFLIAPTTPAGLEAVVAGGELLPQKSTHFYPKLLDGLVFVRVGPPAGPAG